MTKQYQSIRMFKNPILERFSHIHPATPLVFWGPIVSYFLWQSVMAEQIDVPTYICLAVGGLMSWTFVEYVLHRFVFHLEGESNFSKRFHFFVHGVHHEDGNDPTRLVMPPLVSAPLALFFYGFFKLVFGPVLAQPFFAFFVIGYLCYDYIHYYVHFFTPTSRIGKALKSSHMKHHYVDPDSRFGVSSPLWDFIFGTQSGSPKHYSASKAVKH